MQVRSPRILAAGLAMLLVSAVLGAFLVHDGVVGTDEALLDRVDAGDEVILKGEAVACCEASLRPLLRNHSVELRGEFDERVVLTSGDPLPTGPVVVRGEVVHAAVDPRDPTTRLVVIVPSDVSEPLLFG